MERDFKGIWIPKEIWLDDRMTALEKVILAEIDSLDADEYGGCIASNEYLSEFCKCSANKVALAVSKLKEMGYIELVSFDGRTRKLKSRLKENQKQTLKKSKADLEKEKAINITDKKDDYINKERSEERKISDMVEQWHFSGAKVKALDEYIKMRRLIKKPLTYHALELVVKKLETMGDEETQIAVLEQSIANSWQGIFPLKGEEKKNNGCHIAHNAQDYSKDFNEDGSFKW